MVKMQKLVVALAVCGGLVAGPVQLMAWEWPDWAKPRIERIKAWWSEKKQQQGEQGPLLYHSAGPDAPPVPAAQLFEQETASEPVGPTEKQKVAPSVSQVVPSLTDLVKAGNVDEVKVYLDGVYEDKKALRAERAGKELVQLIHDGWGDFQKLVRMIDFLAQESSWSKLKEAQKELVESKKCIEQEKILIGKILQDGLTGKW